MEAGPRKEDEEDDLELKFLINLKGELGDIQWINTVLTSKKNLADFRYHGVKTSCRMFSWSICVNLEDFDDDRLRKILDSIA